MARDPERGFTLVVCVLLLSLLTLIAVGLMSLASIELRKSGHGTHAATARANARLALMQALGQLQRTLGPDQRISATAEILSDSAAQPHWTGVWRSTLPDGTPIFTRDDLAGSLRDERHAQNLDPADQVMEWLVSGTADPLADDGDRVPVFNGPDRKPLVEAPKVKVRDAGHLAWWTGDLGVRANIRTRDPRADIPADPGSPEDGGLFRVMLSQEVDPEIMDGGVKLAGEARGKLVTPGTIALAGVEKDWEREHAFDFTTESSGVLADVADGGLKHDLTAYFENGPAADFMGLPGLADDEPLVGEATGGRYRIAGPRFGLLRDWARLGIPFSGNNVQASLPEMDPSVAGQSAALALANESPVKLAGNQTAALQPVLVEATNYTQISCYEDTPRDNQRTFQLRQLMYPRVVLWNPYNCELKSDRMIIMIQGNGRQEMKTRNSNVNKLWWFGSVSEWLSFEGGRSTLFTGSGGIMNTEGYNDPYMGSYYFSIPATQFGPGECLVFSPARSGEYDGLSPYRPGNYNLLANELSCEVAPDPARSYYVSATDIGGGINFLPVEFWYEPTLAWSRGGRSGVENQADDTRAILKSTGGASTITFEAFDKLPQVAVLSASLQYGAGREPRIQWNGKERMPIQLLDRAAPRPTLVPDTRTRESIRLRWFEEHPSNTGSGALAGTAHFEDALLANWNPRASYIMRSPWENIGGEAPWFFGAYTRDLYDGAVSWDEQMPVPRGGKYHGNPFGPPQEGEGKYILFDVPREETGVVSLGQLQHAKLSELVWHPSYAIGNSLADPRLGLAGMAGTAALAATENSAGTGGFHADDLGWSSDGQRSAGKDEWAATARAILGNAPGPDNLVYDLSFEANRKLWDRFFLSTGTAADKRDFLAAPAAAPLPNGRMKLAAPAMEEDIDDFHRAAYHLMVDGAFNVNSTRVEAWKALLGSTRLSGFGSGENIPFPRLLDPPGGAWQNGGDSPGDADVWSGHRELSPDEIDALARRIVAEVKRRGPFLSLADFVNRRLADDDTGRMGALQAAIESAGLNTDLRDYYPLDNNEPLPDYGHPDNLPDATRMEQTLKPASKAWGATTYLTQADVLQVIGPVLAARSDSFIVRAYGDSIDTGGTVRARAFCEAVVQRVPEPLDPDASGLNPRLAGETGDFGRRFIITSFRWLAPEEI